jgi:hypothetical protein
MSLQFYDQYCKPSFCSQWNQYQEDRLMVDAEPDTAMGIPAWFIEDGSDSNTHHPKRWGLSRQQQVHGIPFSKM